MGRGQDSKYSVTSERFSSAGCYDLPRWKHPSQCAAPDMTRVAVVSETVNQTLCRLRTLILWPYLIKVDELSAGGGLGNLQRSFKPVCQSISALRRPWCVSAITLTHGFEASLEIP